MKNPSHDNDSFIVISILAGVVILVFAGIFITLLLDGTVTLQTTNNGSLQNENTKLKAQITLLEERVERVKIRRLKSTRNLEQQQFVQELKNQTIAATKELDTLSELINCNQTSIQLVHKASQAHKAACQNFVRETAIGTHYKTVTSSTGKTYHDVQITDITARGVSISHQAGASTLGLREMPTEWQHQFMFSALELAEANKQPTTSRNSGAPIKLQTEEQLKLRRAIALLEIKLTAANLEAGLARQQLAAEKCRSSGIDQSPSHYTLYNISTEAYSSTKYQPLYRNKQAAQNTLTKWQEKAIQNEQAADQYSAEITALSAKL